MTPFSIYMQEWLYGKNGYYANMPKIGKEGDFYTSVSASMFFGGSIANRLLKTIDSGFLSKNATVVEIGAHKGYLLADIIQFIYTLRRDLLDNLNFAIVEPLEDVQKAQKEYLKDSFGEALHVKIVKDLSSLACKEAFIISNELFDAFKCEVIYEDKMLYIDEDEAVFGDLSDEAKEISSRYGVKKGEITLGLDEFVKDISTTFKRYEFITFDYGQMESRGDMSLRVYKNHKVYPFFELTKFGGKSDRFADFFASSDITYDVNFLHVKDVFEKFGAKMERFCSQMVALNEFGFTDLLEILYKNVDEKSYRVELEKAKQLILPEFFGERFKMIDFKKA